MSSQLMLLQCPRCGTNYLPDEFRPSEVPRCIDWCEPFDDDVPAGQAPALEGVYLEDLMASAKGA